jgi:hypothetical protein
MEAVRDKEGEGVIKADAMQGSKKTRGERVSIMVG